MHPLLPPNAEMARGKAGIEFDHIMPFAFLCSNRTFAHYRTNEHYERYMHGGLEGVFGKRPDDPTLAADHAV